MPSRTANPPLCAHCGQPVHTASNFDGANYYHGPCYRLEYPPEHPSRPIATMSHEERVQEGLEPP